MKKQPIGQDKKLCLPRVIMTAFRRFIFGIIPEQTRDNLDKKLPSPRTLTQIVHHF